MTITPIFIIGAQKSGSSYLYQLIAQDPYVALSKNGRKGPLFFCKPMHDGSDFYEKFTISPHHRYILDGSDPYMHVADTAEHVAKKIGKDIPLIAVLRDPSDRAISAYLHEFKHGRELRRPEEAFDLPATHLNDAVAAEDAKINCAWRRGDIQPHNPPGERYRDLLFGFRYITNSIYSAQLEPWINLFPNLHFIDFSELVASPELVIERVRKWLGLDESFKVITSQPVNRTRIRAWQALRENRALHHDFSRPSIISVWMRQQALIARFRKEKPFLPPELSALLREDFSLYRDGSSVKWL